MEKFRSEMAGHFTEIYEGNARSLVFGEGSFHSRLMMIGEAPGEQETLKGRPFVGKAGKNLDEFLQMSGLKREEIYITNTVKFRPTKRSDAGRLVNRPPTKEEIALFLPWLKREIGLVGPDCIATLGNVPLMALVMIFMINSANLQDGLDGLLSSVTVISSAAWGLMAVFVALAGGAFMSPELLGNYRHLAVFALALSGACMGFLRFNHYPALVFMGDTGSMFIGGAMVGMAMLLRMPLYMILICFTLIASSMSVIIQRVYFKATHGKRIFRMTPIHHAFEMRGWREVKIDAFFALIAIIGVAMGIFYICVA